MARILPHIGVWVGSWSWSGTGAATLAEPLDSQFTIGGPASVTTLDQIDQIDQDFGQAKDSGTIVFAAPAGQKPTAADRTAVTALQKLVAALPRVAYAITRFVTLTSVAPSLATLLAVAVGIDYSLFIINRHRRHLRDGLALPESIPLAVGTA